MHITYHWREIHIYNRKKSSTVKYIIILNILKCEKVVDVRIAGVCRFSKFGVGNLTELQGHILANSNH